MMILMESAIVRIHRKSGPVLGVGFLVTNRHILTCAHVISDALGVSGRTEEKPDKLVHLDFPLVAPRQMLKGQVVLWQPEADVAGLELTGPPPATTQPARLLKTDDVWGHTFRAFGFPAGYDDGVWASGLLRSKTAAGWLQLEDLKGPGYRVQPGFSGGPVWDEQLNGVVGIAVAAAVEVETKAAFMIPTFLLLKAWPELASVSLDVNDQVYLQEQLTMLETAQQAAPDPYRFKARIEDLKLAIANWEGRVEQQRQRIAQGLAEQRQQVIEVGQQPRDQKRVLVVGRCPLGTVEYFKNRRREQETLGRLLAEPTTRLVSIIGHGGMGKTALASKVLQDLERHHWPHTDQNIPVDGLVYLSTRTAGISLERLFLDCAKMLGEEAEKRLNATWTNPKLNIEDKVSHLLETLKEGVYVILLDNLEDLLDDQGQLVDQDLRLFFDRSLTTSHGVRLLVTSRVTLAFKGEVMRFDRQVKLLDGLPVEDGVALLRELDPNGDYGLRDAPDEQLAQAVSLVHSVPRALEVLVGILANNPFVTLAEVLKQFYEHGDVVQGLIEENYKRLDNQARRVIEALAVFRRPVPPLAVDYLLEPFFPGLDVPGILRRLTRTNILTIDRATKTVVLHPIDQDYAYSQLPEAGEYTRPALECRAADYYVQLRTPSETWKAIDDLEPQLVEFEHWIRAGDYDKACQLLEPIDFDYLGRWGHHTLLIKLREGLSPHLTTPSLQMANIGSLANNCRLTGDIKRAIQFYEQALAIAQTIENRKGEGIWLGNLGSAYRDLGQFARAITYFEQARNTAQETGDRKEEALNLGRLGFAYNFLGNYEQAVKLQEEAITLATQIRDRRREGVFRSGLGLTYYSLGKIEQARHLHQEALDIARELGNRWGEILGFASLGSIYRALAQYSKSIECYQQGLTVTREIGDRREESNHLSGLGKSYFAMGQIEQAINYFEQSLTIARELNNEWRISHILVGLGRAYLSLGIIEKAQCCCTDALALEVSDSSYSAALMLAIVQLHKHSSSAEKVFSNAIDLCRAVLNKTVSLYKARYSLATALVGQTICTPKWVNTLEDERAQSLIPALDEYRQALEICAAPGVIQDTLSNLDLIRKIGVEGLEPIFELLQSGAKE